MNKKPVKRETVPPVVQTMTASAVHSRIHTLYPSLGAAAQRIADYVIEHSADVVHMSVTEVAERTNASEGSVVGFCKRIGATGFQQLKILLAQEIVRPVQLIHEDLQPEDDAGVVIRKIFQSNVQTLRDTQANLDVQAMEKAVRLIKSARRIEIYGSAARPASPRTRSTACCASGST
ncbi:MurR/RpiR family transcriptional regulator [Methylibium sp. T29]|uniref:MurR/RpiR family transcriptional regulator n=1 Tax=Methylibium sp. T29 TaxID=1430884 RepID=UPI0003F405D2|nr:MurR/RpiR family transcriptional regulator [Methylibium sp. T29]EWS54591.1 putative HTH-type transcriptional regulator YbbH [Methylibium sp. T29]